MQYLGDLASPLLDERLGGIGSLRVAVDAQEGKALRVMDGSGVADREPAIEVRVRQLG